MEVNGEIQAPAAFIPRKHPRYPLRRKLGGPRSRSLTLWSTEKILALPGNRTPAVQPVTYRYVG
jgi:hypothetical protein